MNNVTEKTNGLVRDWMHKKKYLARLEAERCTAIEGLTRAETALGEWLVPDDAKGGEEFNLWFGSGILNAWKATNAENEPVFHVKWRKEPDGIRESGELDL